VLVVAVEMHGGAIFRGAASAWTKRGTEYSVPADAWLEVDRELSEKLSQLFVEARRLRATDIEQTIRDADHEHAAREWGRGIRMTRNSMGTMAQRSSRMARGRRSA
jgi:hypothetical protein